MKIPKYTSMILLALLLSVSALAQPDTVNIISNESPNVARPYYERPGFPNSFDNAQRRKSGRSEKYLNVNKLPATLLLGLMNNTLPDEGLSESDSGRNTFGISVYRVQQSLSVCLSIEKELGERVTVRLMNAQGEELHAESVGRLTRKYARRFDLAAMRDGSYTLEVRSGPEVIRRAIKLSSAEPMEKPSRTIASIN